jgi:hypothetical protein
MAIKYIFKAGKKVLDVSKNKTPKKAVAKTAKKVERAKKVSAKKDAASSARGLKAARGPSKAPKGYVPDTARREALKELRRLKKSTDYGVYFDSADNLNRIIKSPAPKNIVSKSGKKSKLGK